MVKPRTKNILKHCALWAVWYLINTLQIADAITTFKTTEWLQLGYNYISLVIVFYCIAGLMARFYKVFSRQIYATFKGAKQARYLFNNHLLLVLMVVALYVCLSVTLDNIFFGYQYPTALSHIIQRLTRVLLYALLADRYAYLYYYKSRVSNYIINNDARFKNLQADNYKIKELYEQLANEKSMN
jgi:hypothetical protein